MIYQINDVKWFLMSKKCDQIAKKYEWRIKKKFFLTKILYHKLAKFLFLKKNNHRFSSFFRFYFDVQ